MAQSRARVRETRQLLRQHRRQLPSRTFTRPCGTDLRLPPANCWSIMRWHFPGRGILTRTAQNSTSAPSRSRAGICSRLEKSNAGPAPCLPSREKRDARQGPDLKHLAQTGPRPSPRRRFPSASSPMATSGETPAGNREHRALQIPFEILVAASRRGLGEDASWSRCRTRRGTAGEMRNRLIERARFDHLVGG